MGRQEIRSAVAQAFRFGRRLLEWRPAQKVEAFLRDYFDLPNLQLVRIWACCNQANGFEEWQFEWLDETKALPEGYVAPKPKAKRASKAATTRPATGQAPVAA
jgi:hypothetical protein